MRITQDIGELFGKPSVQIIYSHSSHYCLQAVLNKFIVNFSGIILVFLFLFEVQFFNVFIV